jgi:hypothetical protein
MAEIGEDSTGLDDDKLGTSDADIVTRWRAELEAARKGPHKRWIERAKKAIRRYRDENVDDIDGGSPKRNAQFNVLWSNAQTIAPSIYSKPPTPVVERRYLDRDVIGRAAATILQRVLAFQVESPESDFHETMRQCRTDFMLVAMGSAWLRYEAEYKPAAPQHTDEKEIAESAADGGEGEDVEGYAEDIVAQKICVDYCHWSDELFSPARFWQELTWRAKRAYYTRRQAVKKFPEHGKDLPLKTTRGKKQNDITDQVKEAIGKAEVWQIWDFVDRKIIYICEDYGVAPLDVAEDELGLKCFTPAARPVRGTTTNDSIYPIPDYTIWHDQAAELDNLTARIAALTRSIKACGVFDASVPELARLLQEGMENKLIGVTNWAKLTQKGGLPGAVSLLPIKELSDALTALYLARAQVKNDLYEISGTSDIVRGASDPNETAAAQKLKGQFSAVRGGDRKSEFDRFVRDTMFVMAEIAVEHFTDETLWLMSDFEQWAKDQDLKAYLPEPPAAPPMPPAPMMGHNGGPPLDMPRPPMAPPAAPPANMPSGPGIAPGNGGAVVNTPAAPMPAMGGSGLPGVATSAPSQVPPSPAPMASTPIEPPITGLPIPGMMPPAPPPSQEMLARELFGKAVKLLRDDKLRSFRIQMETDSTIQPDAAQEQQARVEFLGAVTQFLSQAQEMGAAYPQLMPVLGKFLLFGARGFKVGRDLESSLEAMITDLEKLARNPAPKQPSPEQMKAEAIKAKSEADKELAGIKMQGEQQKLQMEMQRLQAEMMAERERLQMELQKMQAELQGLREKLQMKREEGQIKLQTTQQAASIKQAEGEQTLALKQQEGQIEQQNMHLRGEVEAEGMLRDEAHQARTMDRKEQHDETRMELAEKAAANKAKASAQTAKADGAGARKGS